ncbi:MAG: site-specific DNA-methyltransferase [Candidatus Sericytochromatia bacterium]|nr:site-specific DNA-methyltransferase [Candidatus Sericytochromatia bacterium]
MPASPSPSGRAAKRVSPPNEAGTPVLVWQGKAPASVSSALRLSPQASWGARTTTTEAVGNPQPADGSDHLIQGENLAVLQHLAATGWRGQVKLAYIDPPFDSGADYARQVQARSDSGQHGPAVRQVAYRDVWQPTDYVQFMYERLQAIWALLADDGSLFFHCDYRRAHHMRCLLDEIFGPDRFRNQIVWAYGTSARGAKATAGQFARNHDVILWYGKGPTTAFAPVRVERRIQTGEAKARGFRQDEQGTWFKTAPRGDYTDASIARLESEGRIYRTRTGTIRIKYPLRSEGDWVIEDVLVGDVWTDIPDAMHAGKHEQFNYPTRKPEALLARLIQAASSPDDLILDCFSGSGSTLVAAQRLGRRWIGCDVSPIAIQVAASRLAIEHPATETIGRRGRSAPASSRPGILWGSSGGHVDLAPLSLQWRSDRHSGVLNSGTLTISAPDLPAGMDQDWRSTIEAVYVDPAYDGQRFHRAIADVPVGHYRCVQGTYTVPLPDPAGMVCVQAIDIRGQVWTGSVAGDP